jgi:hypothetical protein
MKLEEHPGFATNGKSLPENEANTDEIRTERDS